MKGVIVTIMPYLRQSSRSRPFTFIALDPDCRLANTDRKPLR
jgi:hypothetical protein